MQPLVPPCRGVKGHRDLLDCVAWRDGTAIGYKGWYSHWIQSGQVMGIYWILSEAVSCKAECFPSSRESVSPFLLLCDFYVFTWTSLFFILFSQQLETGEGETKIRSLISHALSIWHFSVKALIDVMNNNISFFRLLTFLTRAMQTSVLPSETSEAI